MLKRASWLLGTVLVATLALMGTSTRAPMGTSAAQAAQCLPNGVCYTVKEARQYFWNMECYRPTYGTRRWEPNSVEVYFSGAPRVYGEYVATKYNVRETENLSGRWQFSIDRDPASEACYLGTKPVSGIVQGCRYRIQWGRSYCTAWSPFRE